MKNVKNHYNIVLFLVVISFFSVQAAFAQKTISPQDKKTVTEFEKSVLEYVKLRQSVEKQVPKISKESTPEQIEIYKSTFQKNM